MKIFARAEAVKQRGIQFLSLVNGNAACGFLRERGTLSSDSFEFPEPVHFEDCRIIRICVVFREELAELLSPAVS
jgi:hypothetical protein